MPVPDSPMSAARDEPTAEENVQVEEASPSTASLDADINTSSNEMEPVFNVVVTENRT